MFALFQGRLLGHVVSKEGISIDPKRVAAIQKIECPRNKKEIQSFLGTVNFLRKFVSNFAEILREVTNMLKKENQVKWTAKAKQSFQMVKDVISKAPVLASPDCSKYFYVFSFASEFTIAGVLLQKNCEGNE